MNAKKKLIISLGSLAMVFIAAVVAIVAVLAARSTTVTTNSISVTYNAKKVVADIIADRQIFSLNANEEVSGDFVFDSDDSTFKNLATAALSGEETGASANQNKDLSDSDTIPITDGTFTLVRYTFANAELEGGGYSSYSASLEYDVTTFSNMQITFYLSDSPTFNTENGSLTLMGTINGTNYSDGIALSDLTSSGFTIPVGSDAVTSKYVYMVVRVDNLDFDASFSVDFTWNLSAITTAKRLAPINFLSFEPISGKNEASVGLKEEDQQVAYVTIPENTEFVIPGVATIGGTDYPVTTIRENGFKDCANMSSITLPNTITTIGASAFSGCTGLTTIIIPELVTTLGNSVFSGCNSSLEVTSYSMVNMSSAMTGFSGGITLTVPSSTTTIAANTYKNRTDVTRFIIPSTVTGIGNYAFYGCIGISSITIPNSVTSIGYMSFHSCLGLTSITIPSSVTSIGGATFSNCPELESITVDSLNKTYYSYLNGIYQTSNNTLIAGCNETANIKEGTTKIAYQAFYNCTELTAVTIPNSVTNIEGEVFCNCKGLTSITIGNSLTSIGASVFENCSGLTSIIIPNSVTTIGSNAFYYCSNLTSVTIGNSVTTIGSNAFYNCSSLTLIIIPNSVTSIGDSAFQNCSGLTSVTIPNSVTSIGSSAFYYCPSLISITIPSSITSIGWGTFCICSSLTSITIPNSVTSIAEYAFDRCYALAEIYNLSGLNFTIESSDNGKVAYYAKVIHTSADEETRIVNENNVAYYVYGSEKIALTMLDKTQTSVAIANDCTSVNQYAFFNCSKLTSATIGNLVSSIGYYAFAYCSLLTTVTLGSSVTSIDNYAFYLCYVSEVYNLSGLNLVAGSSDNSVVYYANVVHTSLEEQTRIVRENNIAYYVYGSEKIALKMMDKNQTSVTISNDCTRINKNAFNSSKLTEITIPNTVTNIGDFAFTNCSNLTSITIPSSVISIGSNAFFRCYSLKEVYNLSSLSLTAGSSSNGYVACYAKVVHTSLEEQTRIVQENNVAYYVYESEKIALAMIDQNQTSVTIANDCTSIEECAFDECTNLISVIIGNSVASIGYWAFCDCRNISTVSFPSGTNWQVSSSSTFSTITATLSAENITADKLRSTYKNYYWRKVS